jgi:hypothetical protein
MKQIFCPTDFSALANHTIDYAAQLCQAMHGELTLIHIQSDHNSLLDEISAKEIDIYTGLAKKNLSIQTNEVTKRFQITCDHLIMKSNEDIIESITQLGKSFDLIVMGIGENEDFYSFLSERKVYEISKKSFVPVLLIPENCTFKKISWVVHAFEYEHEKKFPLTQLLSFIEALHSQVSILQVKDHYSREVETSSQLVEERTKMLYNMTNISFDTIYSNEVSQSINSYVTLGNADALALCSAHHNLIEKIFQASVIKEMVSIARLPLFIFHR